MKRPYRVELVHPAGNIVGECPVWNARERALYWVDTRLPALYRLNTDDSVDTWNLPHKIGSFGFRERGGLVAGMQVGFCELDLDPVRVNVIAAPEAHKPDNRMNDGKCDRRGRFWCGSRDPTDHNPGGALYRLDPDHHVSTIDDGFIVLNGLAFSPDDRTMVCGCTRGEVMYKYDFDLDSGSVANRREFLRTDGLPWQVDGATFDSAGFYWCALLGGGAIGRFDPDGRLDRLVPLPVKYPTMCSFGGDGYDILYVTSASVFVPPEEQAAQKLAGALFAVHGLGVTGLPEPVFAG